MSFREDIPDYLSYDDTEFFCYRTIPDGLWKEIGGVVLKASDNEPGLLKELLDNMSEIIPYTISSDTGWVFLQSELQNIISSIRRKASNGKAEVLFDCLAVLLEYGDISEDYLNDLLLDNRIGYEAKYNPFLEHTVKWSTRENITSTVSNITETQEAVQSDSQQAFDELERAKNTLRDSNSDEKARKEAVRNCVSAMEALVKVYGEAYGESKDIKAAYSHLRSSGQWGCNDIVKRGVSIFDKMHKLYPDLRHGSTKTSSMSLAEAEYWIDVITAYIKYLKKMAKKNGID